MSRKWTREHFVDHPRFIKRQVAANRPPEVWANASKDKIKLICRYSPRGEYWEYHSRGGDYAPFQWKLSS